MQLVRLTPQVGSAGSVLSVSGRDLGSRQGDWTVVVLREGSTKRLKTSVLSWSSTEVRLRLPAKLPAGTYDLFVVGPPAKGPAAESNRLTLGVVPRLRVNYQPGRDAGGGVSPDVHLRGDLTKPPDSEPTHTDVRLSDEFTRGLTGDIYANCPDPALLSVKPLSPVRRSDGSYDFLLHVNVRNSGGGAFAVPKSRTLLIIKRDGRQVYKANWSAPSTTIKLYPNDTRTEDVRMSRFQLKKNDGGLTVSIAFDRQSARAGHPDDCNPANNEFHLDGRTLTRALVGAR